MNHHGVVEKYYRFINRTQLLFVLCNFRALCKAKLQSGSWQASTRNSADEFYSKNCKLKNSTCMTLYFAKVQHHYNSIDKFDIFKLRLFS